MVIPEKVEALVEFKRNIDDLPAGRIVHFRKDLGNYWTNILRRTCLFTDVVTHNGKKGPKSKYIRTEKIVSHDEFFDAAKFIKSEYNKATYENNQKRIEQRIQEAKKTAEYKIPIDPNENVPKNANLVFMTESEFAELQTTMGDLSKKVDELSSEVSSLRVERNNAFDEVKELTNQNRILEATIKEREKRTVFQGAKKADTNWIQDFRR